MPDASSSFYEKRLPKRKEPLVDTVMKPVVGGIMRIGQGVAGLADGAADYTLKSAEKAKEMPKEKPMGWSDIPRTVWNSIRGVGSKETEAKALENSHQHAKQLAPAARAVKSEAGQDYDFAKKNGDSIEASLGTGGKIAMKAVEQAPQLAMSGAGRGLAVANAVYGALSEIGKGKSVKSAVPQIAADTVVRGNSLLSNAVQPAVEEAVSAGNEFFKKRKPQATAAN